MNYNAYNNKNNLLFMTKNLNIYVATMTGTALMVADEIEDFCKTEGINTNIVEMDALEPKNLEDINAPF